jgi:hypothetical protein
MAKTKFSDKGVKVERKVDTEAADMIAGEETTAMTVAPSVLPPAVIGQATGDVDKTDIKLPRLELVYGVGELVENFSMGDVVYNHELCLVHKGETLRLTVASIQKYYIEDLPYEPSREVMPRLFATKEEVQAAGLWVTWDTNGQRKPPVAECADILMVIECPEGVDDSLFPLCYTEGDKSISLAVAKFTVRKTSYTRVAKPIFSAQKFFLRDSLLLGRWELQTEIKKLGNNMVTTPSLRNTGKNSPEFVAFLVDMLG